MTESFREDPDYPDPTEQDLESPEFNAVWKAIKGWDISRYNDGLYSGATGNDVMHILRVLGAAIDEAVREEREAMLAFGKRAVSDTDSRFDAPAEGERGHREYMRGWRRAWQSFEAAIRARSDQ